MQRGQSEALVPMLDRVMQEAEIPWRSLDAIAATNGPGGFTGVRIGLAAAQGLALAWDLPVVTVSCFEATYTAIPAEELGERWILLLIEAKRAEVYAQLIDPHGTITFGPALQTEDALRRILPDSPLLLAGDAALSRIDGLRTTGMDLRLSKAPGLISAGIVARLAATRPLPERPWPLPEPLYLRAADTSKAKALK